jgi:magnesium-protoporphyrin O-methyltransferase
MMLPTVSYLQRRGQIEQYFDRTAAETWKRLTSTAPVSGIRATVRAGRAQMRNKLLSWLPANMHGLRLLDAGCGTGVLAMEAVQRGAEVVAIDLSSTLVQHAAERAAAELGKAASRLHFHVGDFLDPALGRFDHVVAMDSLIHYDGVDVLRTLSALAERTTTSILFTFAPRTPLLTLMHKVGKAFPRSDRSPMIEPLAESALRLQIDAQRELSGWHAGRSQRVARGFYISQAMELARA